MIDTFVASIARIAVPLVLAVAGGAAVAQTITYSNSPGGYPGTVTYAGGTTSLQTGTPIDVFDNSTFWGNQFNFSFQTGLTADGWTFGPGGTVSMVATGGWSGGIDTNNDLTVDIPTGTTIFTGVLGTTTVHDRRGPADAYGNRYEVGPPYIGSSFDISGTFTVSNLNAAYATAFGKPTGPYTGSFLLGIDSWNGDPATARVGWREVTLTFDQQAAPVPEPETYAMMLAGLGLLGIAARRRQRKAARG